MRSTVVLPDADELARHIGDALVVHVSSRLAKGRPVHVVLTGGTIGIRALEQVAAHEAAPAVDWDRVHVWWGDERFLPTGHPERNETQARAALLDDLDLPEANIHAMAAADAPGITSPEDAARAYADELARHAVAAAGPADRVTDDAGPLVPAFDLLLLGMGPDGHVASLFPGHAALDVVDLSVVGVHGSPKPPPERVSLTYPAIEAAESVWLLVSGAEKAPAVLRGLDDDEPAHRTPAAGVRGRQSTTWYLDADAAPPED